MTSRDFYGGARKGYAAASATSTPAERNTAGDDTRRSTRNTADRPAEEDHRPRPAAPPAGHVVVYFDPNSGAYYALNATGEYQRYPDRALSLKLRDVGFSKLYQNDKGLSYLEAELLRITNEQTVHFAGPLGGFDPGLYEMNGFRILVTRGPRFIVPQRGNWSILKDFLQVLFGDQFKYFCAWCKVALEAIRCGPPWSPGQMLAIAGPPGAGKSLLQSLITPLLGGRASSPYKYLTNSTSFNAEIFGAEHALIGDQNHAVDNRSRRAFGSSIKDLVANKEQYVHTKGKTAITLTPFLRLTISLNDNPAAMLVLPAFDSDVADKIMLLRVRKGEWAWPSKRFPDSQSFFRQLIAELPAFVFALKSWKIPEAIKDQRYGVVSFKDPELIGDVENLSDEENLMDVIDTYIFGDGIKDHWAGTATELSKLLSESMKPSEIARLFRYTSHCGQMLATLALKYPERIEATKRPKLKNIYLIRRV